jgi:NitT/TauT family transport system permease protein
MNLKRIIFYYLIPLVIVLLGWDILAGKFNLVRLLISSPSLVFEYFSLNIKDLMEACVITFIESLTGLALATLIAFIFIILGIYFPRFMDWILPISIISQVIPLITLAPMFIILFGYGLFSKIMMAVLICFFPIFINFANGIKAIQKELIEYVELFDVSKMFKIKKIYIPLSLQYIFAGMKISATLSIIGAIVAEFNGTRIGLGKNLFLAAKRLEPELMISSLFLTAILGGLSYIIIIISEKYFGKWYQIK